MHLGAHISLWLQLRISIFNQSSNHPPMHWIPLLFHILTSDHFFSLALLTFPCQWIHSISFKMYSRHFHENEQHNSRDEYQHPFTQHVPMSLPLFSPFTIKELCDSQFPLFQSPTWLPPSLFYWNSAYWSAGMLCIKGN